MSIFLDVVYGNTKPSKLQFIENSVPMIVSGVSIVARVATFPETTTVIGILKDAQNAEFTLLFSEIAPGSYDAEIDITDSEGTLTSDLFTLNVRNRL